MAWWTCKKTDKLERQTGLVTSQFARVKSERKVLLWVLFLMPINDSVGIPPRNLCRLIRYYLIIDSMCRFVPRGFGGNQKTPWISFSCWIRIISFSLSYLTLYPFIVPLYTRGADTSCWWSSNGVRRPGVHDASNSLQYARRLEA